MTRTVLIVLAASGLVLAQDQSAGGGWRRVGDAPPPSAPAAAPPATPAPPVQGQNPEPVDRSDEYGQPPAAPDATNVPPAAPAPAEVPPSAYPAPQGPQAYPAPQGPEAYPAPQGPGAYPGPQSAPYRSAYGLPAELTLKPGTYLTARIAQMLSSDHNHPGDTFVAHLIQPVVVDGVVVAQRGQPVYGRVVQVQKQKSGTPSSLRLELTGITLADGNQVPVHSQLVTRTGSSTPKGIQAGEVAGATGVGAIIGGAVGWGTGAAIGAGAGAVAGVAGVLLTRNHPTVVYPETALVFDVQTPVTISTAAAPQAFHFAGPQDYAQPSNAQLRPRPPMGAYYSPYAAGPYGYGYPYYPYPYVYAPYPYWGWGWGPGFGVVIGRGGYWGRWR